MKTNKKSLCYGSYIKFDLLLIALTLLCYYPSLSGDFVFDDSEAILKNPDTKADSAKIVDLFQHDFWGNNIRSEVSHKSYRPLTVLVYWLVDWFSADRGSEQESADPTKGDIDNGKVIIHCGNNQQAFHYHVLNVILYCVLACSTLRTLRKLLKTSILQLNDCQVEQVSRTAVVLFVIHPVHSESVITNSPRRLFSSHSIS